MSRVFKYKELDFADPGEQFTNDEVLAILSKTFPELVDGKIATTTSADGNTTTVTFEPKAKRNGVRVSMYSTPSERARAEYWLNQDALPMSAEERVQRHQSDCLLALTEAITELYKVIAAQQKVHEGSGPQK